MAYTFLSASFTKTYFAPSLAHFTVHSAAPSCAALAPHLLSVMYPVQLPSPAMASAPAKSAITIAAAKRIFMLSLLGCLILMSRFPCAPSPRELWIQPVFDIVRILQASG